jgi:hypothetical protein
MVVLCYAPAFIPRFFLSGSLSLHWSGRLRRALTSWASEPVGENWVDVKSPTYRRMAQVNEFFVLSVHSPKDLKKSLPLYLIGFR